METAITLLQDDHIRSKLKILVNLLEELDDHFACIVAPLLSILGVVCSSVKGFEYEIVNLLLNR